MPKSDQAIDPRGRLGARKDGAAILSMTHHKLKRWFRATLLPAPLGESRIAAMTVDLQDARKISEMDVGPFSLPFCRIDIGDHQRTGARITMANDRTRQSCIDQTEL
jgi:hypothetical protein